jgi:hypothetical protein
MGDTFHVDGKVDAVDGARQSRHVMTTKMGLPKLDQDRVVPNIQCTTDNNFPRKLKNAVHFAKSKVKGQGDEDFDAVSIILADRWRLLISLWNSGLDNAGKTTIVKKIMGEDVNTVSPTLGFIIKTIDYEG